MSFELMSESSWRENLIIPIGQTLNQVQGDSLSHF